MWTVKRPAAVGIARPEIDIGAGASLKHVGKIFRPHYETSIPIYVRLAHKVGRDICYELRLRGIVDERSEHVWVMPIST
jgi:hypothetical protein